MKLETVKTDHMIIGLGTQMTSEVLHPFRHMETWRKIKLGKPDDGTIEDLSEL